MRRRGRIEQAREERRRGIRIDADRWSCVLIALSCAACSPTTYRWKEAVQLSGGELLEVQRTIQFKAYQPLGGGGGGSDIPESTLQVVKPAEGAPAIWSVPHLIPMVLDKDPVTREWFVVATFHMCSAWHELGRPKLPYAQFQYREGAWVRVPLSPGVMGRAANLLIPNQANVTQDHTLESKQKLMSNPTMDPSYQHVVPEWAAQCR